MRPAGALAGIRVIDLSRVLAGPWCTQMLADHRADGIKGEPPSGDETRALGLDLSHPDGQATLFHLLEGADVLVENFVPGTMARWGLDYETVLRHRFPRLVYCAISGFGPDGPLGGLPGYDAVVQAMCGLMSVNGDPASGPTRVGVPVVDHLTGYTALTGILLALVDRARTGLGQRVEATLFDSALSLLVPHAANWMHSGRTPGLLGSAHPNIAPYDKFACRDGAIFLGILNDRQFRRFCEHIGLDELLADERFASNRSRLQHRDLLRGRIEAALAPLSRDVVCRELMREGVPVGPVNTVPEHRQMRVELDGYRGVGVPTKLSRTPGQPGGAPPAYGQHTEEVLRESGLGESRIAALRERGVLPGRPGK